jgi:alpha-amylase
MINGTMIQYFHWYIASDGTFWKRVKEQAEYLADLGINSVWLPPAHKGKDGGKSSGYDMYDLYDLGEFDQKGSVRTKYGTAAEYRQAVASLREKKIGVYADIVLNHMGGADETERVMVRKVNAENRNEFISEPFEIDAYTKFTFPGRKGKYSQFIWDHRCFTGVDYAHDLGERAIYTIINEYGEGWEEVIDTEKGNYDYLMFCDIEFRNPAVREELKRFGAWYLNQIDFDGMRLDAVKHIAPPFIIEWLDHMRSLKPSLFAVGEYWAPGDLPLLLKYLDAVGNRMSLFDASLHHNFHEASLKKSGYDLTKIFDETLVAARPLQAVTVVDNHDTQPLQALEAPVEDWFKPLAYALTLLRKDGYPCVFYPDLYGATYRDRGRDGQMHDIELKKCEDIEKLVKARKIFSYGEQRDYFNDPHCIGWIREGSKENDGSGCAVVMSNANDGSKKMELGRQHAGKTFIDLLHKHDAEVKVEQNGTGDFPVKGSSVSVWVHKDYSNL